MGAACVVGYVPQVVEMDREFPNRVWEKSGADGVARLPQTLPAHHGCRAGSYFLHALEQVDMLDMRQCHFGELSVGQRQRVYIARALGH